MSARKLNLGAIRYLIIDIDGVLWHGSVALPGVAPFFRFLSELDIRYQVATNNAARPISETIARLKHLGVKVDQSAILTSGQATAMYLPRIAPRGSRVLLVGGEGVASALVQAGYELVDSNAEVVVAGLDPNLTYDKLRRATLEIRRGARFVGTNGDRTYPVTEGLAPGAGAILAALEAATDVKPIIIGKPQRAMFDVALERMGGDPAVSAMLGDRLDTDIQGAQNAGLVSILVLTGVTSEKALLESPIKPDYIFRDLPELQEAWERNRRAY